MIRSLDIELDGRNGVPFYRQIVDRVRFAVANGALFPGDRLPTVRQLAVDLSINPNTVARAYRELELLGAVASRRGSGTFISESVPAEPEFERRKKLEALCREIIAQSHSLGYSLSDVIDTLEEFRRQHRPHLLKRKS